MFVVDDIVISCVVNWMLFWIGLADIDGQHPHSGSMKLHHHPSADLWSHLSALNPNSGTLPAGSIGPSPFVGLRLPGLFPYASATSALPSLYGSHHHPHQLVYPQSSASNWNLKSAASGFLPRYWLPHWASNPAALFDPALNVTQPQTEKSLLYSALQRSSPDSLPEAPETLPEATPSVTDKNILDLRVKNEPTNK